MPRTENDEGTVGNDSACWRPPEAAQTLRKIASSVVDQPLPRRRSDGHGSFRHHPDTSAHIWQNMILSPTYSKPREPAGHGEPRERKNHLSLWIVSEPTCPTVNRPLCIQIPEPNSHCERAESVQTERSPVTESGSNDCVWLRFHWHWVRPAVSVCECHD